MAGEWMNDVKIKQCVIRGDKKTTVQRGPKILYRFQANRAREKNEGEGKEEKMTMRLSRCTERENEVIRRVGRRARNRCLRACVKCSLIVTNTIGATFAPHVREHPLSVYNHTLHIFSETIVYTCVLMRLCGKDVVEHSHSSVRVRVLLVSV